MMIFFDGGNGNDYCDEVDYDEDKYDRQLKF